MNQLHSLLIQANDDNRMTFLNLKTVALFSTEVFDIITLMAELVKTPEGHPRVDKSLQLGGLTNERLKGDIGGVHGRSQFLESIDKDAMYKKNIKFAKEILDLNADIKEVEKFEPIAKEMLKKGIQGSKGTVDFKSPTKALSQTVGFANIQKVIGGKNLNEEISFKERVYTKQECYEVLDELFEKAYETKTSLIFEASISHKHPSTKRTSVPAKGIIKL